MKLLRMLGLLLLCTCAAVAQTTYYQNMQYAFRSSAGITANGLFFTAQDSSTVYIGDLMALPGFSCVGQAPPYLGWQLTSGVCTPVTSQTFGPLITPPVVARCPNEPSSSTTTFADGSVLKFTYTYQYRSGGGGKGGGGAGCFAITLTGTYTLN